MTLPPKPANVSYNVRVQGSRPVNVLGPLSNAQEFARSSIEAGMEVVISDAATGEVIERHPARTA
jgi:hypothetical protein